MARDDKKAEDARGATVGPGSPAEPFAGMGTGVTTSGVRALAGGGAAGGGTATAKLMAIYDDHEDELRARLHRLGVKSSNLEDAMQRLMMRVLRHVMTTEELPDKPKAYLFKAAENVANDFLNEQRKHALVAGDQGDGEGEIPAPSSRQGMFQTLLEAQRMGLVEKGLAKLSPADREIIRKVYFEGLTREEIAEELGIDGDAAKKRCQRALARLREVVLGDCSQDDMEEGAA